MPVYTSKLNVAEGCWNTCVHAGGTTTFRVLSPENGEPVDAAVFLTALAARIHAIDESLKEITSDVSGADATATEREEEVRSAAETVYKSLEVEVSLLDDPAAVPEDPSCDAAVDLWLPMHLAVVAQHQDAIRALLAFHQCHALAVLQQLAGSTLGVEECVPGSAVAGAGAGLNATVSSLISASSTTGGTTGADDDVPASGEQTPSNKSSHAQGPIRSSASPVDMRLAPTGETRTALPTRRRPVIELQVRPELGSALVLLGHYVTTPASAAAATAPAPAATRTTKPMASPLRRSSLEAPTSTLSHSIHPSRSPSVADRSAPHHADPTTDACSDDDAAEWLSLNLRQAEIEDDFFTDASEELCVGNVLGMLKPLVRLAAAKDPSVGDLVDPEWLSHLYVGHSVVCEACDGDLNRLESVLLAFQGTLTPVLRGKSLPYTITSKSVVQQRNSLNAKGAGGLVDTPTLRPISRTPSGLLFESLGTPRGRASVSGSGGGGGAATTTPSLPPGVHVTSLPFWLHCAPQEAQLLAFCGAWVAFREQFTEGTGSARMHRHMSIRQDYRLAVAGLKRIRMPNLSQLRGGAHVVAIAKVVPTASSIVSSGQLLLTSRLLSPECRVEEFLDLTDDASIFHSLAPSTFSAAANPSSAAGASNNSSFCGILPLVLAASAFAAAQLRSPGQIRLLVNKLETLIGDTRNSTLRSYVCGRPVTHSERFEELWLSESQNSAPKKFKTRAELLFYSTIEQVLVGAERSWAEETSIFAENAKHQPSGATDWEYEKNFQARLATMAKALQAWIALWRNFLISVRDRPVGPGGAHRRSVSGVGRTSATATPKMQPATAPANPPPPFEEPVDTSNPAGVMAFSPDPVAAVTAAVAAGANPAGAPEEDEVTEATEMIQRLLDALPLRLQHGEPPLPDIGAQLFPPSATAPTTEDPSTVTELPQTTLDAEFAYSQKAFGDMAGSEPNDVKLKFYGLFKQATVGDINVSKPWLMDQVGRAKWEAWSKLKGMNSIDAKRMYVSEFKLLKHMRSSAAAKTQK